MTGQALPWDSQPAQSGPSPWRGLSPLGVCWHTRCADAPGVRVSSTGPELGGCHPCLPGLCWPPSSGGRWFPFALRNDRADFCFARAKRAPAVRGAGSVPPGARRPLLRGAGGPWPGLCRPPAPCRPSDPAAASVCPSRLARGKPAGSRRALAPGLRSAGGACSGRLLACGAGVRAGRGGGGWRLGTGTWEECGLRLFYSLLSFLSPPPQHLFCKSRSFQSIFMASAVSSAK